MFDLQADLQTGAARQGEDSNKEDAEAASSATDAEDVSERWDDKKRQDAVETLLGSCAGNDFMGTANPPKVCSYRESDELNDVSDELAAQPAILCLIPCNTCLSSGLPHRTKTYIRLELNFIISHVALGLHG